MPGVEEIKIKKKKKNRYDTEKAIHAVDSCDEISLDD